MAINTWHSFHFFWTVLLLLFSFVIRCLRYALGTIKRSTNRAIKTHFIRGTWQRTLWQTFSEGSTIFNLHSSGLYGTCCMSCVCVCLERVPCATHFSLSFSRPWGCHKKVSAQFLARIPKIRWHFHYDSLLFGFFFRVAFASFTSSMASNSTWLIRVNKKRLKLLFAIKNSRKLAQISYASLWLCIFRKPTNGKLIKWKLLAKFSCTVRCVWRSWPQHVPRHSFGFLA